MPSQLTTADRRLFLAASALFVVLMAASALLSGGLSNQSERATSYSAGSGGAKAAYLLLEESGYPVERFERPISDLPNGANTTLVVADPETIPTIEARGRIRRFIEEGGRVIATGVSGSTFLPERHVVPDPVSSLTWITVPAVSPSSITRAAARITIAPESFWSSGESDLTLYADNHPRAVQYRFGAGEVIWWAAATPLTNAGIKEAGNLELLLASIGSPDRRILWDESLHGYVRSPPASLIRTPVAGLAVQLGLFAAAVLFTFSRRSGPIVPLFVEKRLSPLEFVRTLGSLYQRAGAAPVAVDIAYQRFRFALAARLGIAPHSTAEELERASRDRWPLDQDFGDVLRACEAADAGVTSARALALTQALHDYRRRLELGDPNARRVERILHS